MLQSDVKQALADAQEHSAYTSLHKEDIEACAALTQSLEAVANASTVLEAAEEAILGSNLTAACDSLDIMQQAMAALPSVQTEIGAGAVCKVTLMCLSYRPVLSYNCLIMNKGIEEHCSSGSRALSGSTAATSGACSSSPAWSHASTSSHLTSTIPPYDGKVWCLQVIKCVRGGVPREEHLHASESEGILLQDIWRAVLTTKEGDAAERAQSSLSVCVL